MFTVNRLHGVARAPILSMVGFSERRVTNVTRILRQGIRSRTSSEVECRVSRSLANSLCIFKARPIKMSIEQIFSSMYITLQN